MSWPIFGLVVMKNTRIYLENFFLILVCSYAPCPSRWHGNSHKLEKTPKPPTQATLSVINLIKYLIKQIHPPYK